MTLKLVMMSMAGLFFHINIDFSEISCALYFGDGYTFKLQDPLPHTCTTLDVHPRVW